MLKSRNLYVLLCGVLVALVGLLAVLYSVVENNPDFLKRTGKSDTVQADASDKAIIKSISPSDEIRVCPGEEIAIMVVAHNEAEVFVRLGATEYKAEKQGDAKGDTAFFAKIKMPTDVGEISSLGTVRAVASLNGETQQLKGPEINPVILQNSVGTTVAQSGTTKIEIGNFNPTYIDVEQQVLPSISDAINRATTNSFYTPFTGNQMAVVAVDYADVKPSGNDSDYAPYCPSLPRGTMDFVVGESESTDPDEGSTDYYYDLSCGLKVKRDSVVLQPAYSMPENSLRVNSVYGSDGELTIRLSSTWKVPYTIQFENQGYYSRNSKEFYVSDFSATAISFVFNYTGSASGSIDCSASDVVSSAGWSVSSYDKTATLYMPLRNQGEFYGYSFSYEGDETVLTIKSRPKGISGNVVVLDPGHGYDDPGATGIGGAVKESDINILVAYQVKDALEAQGVTVYMTRYGDDDINLEGRKIFARTVKSDLFVSIHSNASENTSSIGTSVFYFKPYSMSLAENIYDEIVTVYRDNLYYGRSELYGEIARGVKYYPFSVARLEECPSTLIEIGFMTNDAECYMLTLPENQRLLGQAIARGICNTLS